MVDRQFSNQNGVSVAVLPSPAITPEPMWISAHSEPTEKRNKKIRFDDNMPTMERVVLCLAEIGGTAVLVFLGCMGCSEGVAGKIPNEQIALTFGLAIMISVQIFGHISGCHINPMVTVAAATLGNIPLIQIPIFFIGQMLGGLAGFGLLRAVTPTHMIRSNANVTLGLCSPGFNPSLTPVQALLTEFILSMILVWVCCGVWDNRNSSNSDSVSIRLGLAVAGLAMAGGPYSGANLNPARSFGPALINGDWEHHWVYWVGPMSAGVLGALFYRLVFGKEPSLPDATFVEPTEKT